MYIIIYVKEQHKERKNCIPSDDSFPKCLQHEVLSEAEAKLIWISHVIGRGSSTWAILCWFRLPELSGSLIQKHGAAGTSTPTWDRGVPSDALNLLHQDMHFLASLQDTNPIPDNIAFIT